MLKYHKKKKEIKRRYFLLKVPKSSFSCVANDRRRRVKWCSRIKRYVIAYRGKDIILQKIQVAQN